MEPEAQDQAHFIIHFLLTLKTRFMRALNRIKALFGMMAAASMMQESKTITLTAMDIPDMGDFTPLQRQHYHGAGNGRSRKAKPNRKHHSTRARNRARRK